ncbi:MAG: right-handed parallel beta-helix repeat-containing protein [Halanaeroarchaeum sp.]
MKQSHLREKGLAIFLVITLVLSVLAFAPAATVASTGGQTLTVNDDDASGDDDDADLTFHSLQPAINAAEPGDEIHVVNGTYHESVVVDKQLVIYGDGAGETILKGDQATTMYIGADKVELFDMTIEAPKHSWHSALSVDCEPVEDHAYSAYIHDNVFVGHGGTGVLVAVGPWWGQGEADGLKFVDNHLTGGELDYWSGWHDSDDKFTLDATYNDEHDGHHTTEMGVALWANGDNGLYKDNTFDVKVKFAAVYVAGSHNTFENTEIPYPGDSWSGFAIGKTGDHTTVDELFVDGHPDEHQHTQDPVTFGVLVGGSSSKLTDVESIDSQVGVKVGSMWDMHEKDGLVEIASENHWTVEKVVFNHLVTDGNDEMDLWLGDNSKRVTVNTMAAKSTLSPEPNEQHVWWGPSNKNVFAEGYKHTLDHVTSKNPAKTGIKITADDTTVNSAHIKNKGIGEESEADGYDGDTGIAIDHADDVTVKDSLIENNDVGIGVYHASGTEILHNNPGIYKNAEVGIKLYDADETHLLDNDVKWNGLGMWVKKSDPVRAEYNNFRMNNGGHEGMGDGILALEHSMVDATWNWWDATNGPGGGATDGVLTGDGDTINSDKTSEILATRS